MRLHTRAATHECTRYSALLRAALTPKVIEDICLTWLRCGVEADCGSCATCGVNDVAVDERKMAWPASEV